MRPNPSLEPTHSGKAPWPPSASYHVAPVGQGAIASTGGSAQTLGVANMPDALAQRRSDRQWNAKCTKSLVTPPHAQLLADAATSTSVVGHGLQLLSWNRSIWLAVLVAYV